jgi:hypothetical protein
MERFLDLGKENRSYNKTWIKSLTRIDYEAL